MGTIYIRLLRDRKTSILIYCISGVLMLWMYVAMFPGIQQNAEDFDKILEVYPEQVLEVFNIQELSFNRIESFLSLEYFSIIWPLIAIFLSISLATLSIASGVERGTIELPLAQPISRIQLFTARYLAGLTAITLFTGSSIFVIAPLASIHNVDFAMENFVSVAILSLLFTWAVYSIAFFFSALFSERSRSFMATGMVILLMYVLNIIAALKDNLENLQYGSFFYYFDYSGALIHNSISTTSVIVYAVVIAIFTTAAGYWFNKRDIAV